MKFFADLHIHSKYSRATARNLDLENIYINSQLKGLSLVSTGDFTHPAWFDEIKTKLEPDEGGLFNLKSDICKGLDKEVPHVCRRNVKFILCTEISNIYKKDGKTRKNHNLVFLPSLDSAELFNSKLARIGNIESDGRPILGLDSRDLLEIVLETDEKAFLIPAHIWTPWFSLLGSKSGFDSVEECFEDLSDYIFALETGLSSDPPMNWRVSSLDKYILVSNSDAHSPSKLAREANIFNTELSYFGILKSLKENSDEGFLGTIEFFPEEGKYHIDGHRKCSFSCHPKESMKLKNICPVCGKPLTLGVLYRVEQLADRSEPIEHSKSKSFLRLIQLQDVLAELFQMGSKTKKVASAYQSLINRFGSELEILINVDLPELEKPAIPLLREAIERIRNGNIIFSPGYDGVFGKLKIFSEDERNIILGQKVLFPVNKKIIAKKNTIIDNKNQYLEGSTCSENIVNQKDKIKINEEQRKVIEFGLGPMLIVAGPGTGKTFTITRRIERLIKSGIADPDKIMVVTFTNKAAHELSDRISSIVSSDNYFPTIGTFHSICFQLLKKYDHNKMKVIDEKQKTDIIGKCKAILNNKNLSSRLSPAKISEIFSLAKLKIPFSFKELVSDKTDALYLENIYDIYKQVLESQDYLDYDDLILIFIEKLDHDENFSDFVKKKIDFLFIDEYQDINYPQYLLIKKISSNTDNICVIGDPDQAIYGFRGSDLSFFKRFIEDYPGAEIFRLTRNYRSTDNILNASNLLIKNYRMSIDSSHAARTYSLRKGKSTITVLRSPSEKAEAVAVGKMIDELVGGSGFHAIDFDNFDYSVSRNISFGDIAVLFRTSKQSYVFEKVFSRAGIPFQKVKKKSIVEDKDVESLLALVRLSTGHGTITDLEKIIKLIKPSVDKKTIEKFIYWVLENKFSLEKAINISKRIPLGFVAIDKQKEIITLFSRLSEMKANFIGNSVAVILQTLISDTFHTEDLNLKGDDFRFEFLLEKAREFGSDVEGFLASISLCKDQDVYNQLSEKVSLMTMHAAKGLEFPVVFVTGCEDGIIPYLAKEGSSSDIDEERRLFYVSMTRAKDLLFLSYAEKRKIYGKLETRRPSPFLRNIGSKITYNDPRLGKKPKTKGSQQLLLFD